MTSDHDFVNIVHEQADSMRYLNENGHEALERLQFIAQECVKKKAKNIIASGLEKSVAHRRGQRDIGKRKEFKKYIQNQRCQANTNIDFRKRVSNSSAFSKNDTLSHPFFENIDLKEWYHEIMHIYQNVITKEINETRKGLFKLETSSMSSNNKGNKDFNESKSHNLYVKSNVAAAKIIGTVRKKSQKHDCEKSKIKTFSYCNIKTNSIWYENSGQSRHALNELESE